MFMAELKNFLLTAGHDLDAVETPLRIGVAAGDETYVRMNGEEQTLQAGDMMIADRAGVISCIIYGPDKRTRIRPETRRAAFTVYAPPGIGEEAVQRHLAELRDNVKMVAPEASVAMLEVFGAP
jgi:DNA/RNA-binding domain of Phe-tRNA-synthetase-like protein